MRKCTIVIEMENAAFDDDPQFELSMILHRVACNISDGWRRGPISDRNGNTVGRLDMEE